MDISVGTWIDNRTNIGKRGKFRPFILWSAIPLALLLIANFTMPNFSVTGQLVWAYVAYMLFGTCYSISNIPFGSMIPTMTKNSQERSELASYRQAGSNLGLMVATIGFMPIVTSLPNEKNWLYGCRTYFCGTWRPVSMVFICQYQRSVQGTSQRKKLIEKKSRIHTRHC